jgi:flagellar basal-body rod modification protein FlgD
MATVQSTSSSNSAADIYASLNGKTSGKTASQNEEVQDRFLKLLVTQLKNQDPLNPLDNAQVTSQLSQINTVSGIEKLNTTLNKMFEIYDSGQAMQAAGLIGKHVLVAGNTLPLQGGVALGGGTLPEAADSVTVTVLDKAGNALQTQQLGAQEAGNFGFSWDGKKADGSQVADGDYSFRLDAQRGGKKVTVTGMQVGTVNAVVRGTSGFQLDLGAQGSVGFKDVQQIL